MVKGPLGRELRFIDDNRTIIVLVGLSGEKPSRSEQIELRDGLNKLVNQAFIDNGVPIDIQRDTVNLTVGETPTSEQKATLGENINHTQQYDIKTEIEQVPQSLVNRAHNTVVDEVTEAGYDIMGTETTVS